MGERIPGVYVHPLRLSAARELLNGPVFPDDTLDVNSWYVIGKVGEFEPEFVRELEDK